MYAYNRATQSSRDNKFGLPSEELRIAVTFRRPDGGNGPTKCDAPLSLSSVSHFVPDPLTVDEAIHRLSNLGFVPTQRGRLSVSIRGTRALLEQTFGTQLAEFQMSPRQDYAFQSFYYPPDGASWSVPPALADMIDDAYIQWPHIYMASRKPLRRVSLQRNKKKTDRSQRVTAGAIAIDPARTFPQATPPKVDYYQLSVPDHVSALLNASQVHQAGTTGRGVRVVMVDTGFAHGHPWFVSHGFKTTVDLAPHAINDSTDINGHGTGESANLLSVAPGVTFVGVKVDNDNDPRGGASMLEGFQQALLHQPQVISLSMGYDLRASDGTQLTELPNNLAALEAEIQAAVANGIIVVFSAGNGHYSFPGMMGDVISAGGVFVDAAGAKRASDYASAFHSKIYPGRSVPDFCGLVGLLPHASYIMLPIPPGSEIDKECSQPDDGLPGDGTGPNDGWGVFSGTSAAAPQLAGVCALLLEKNPGLTPSDIKAILRRSARSVTVGSANPASGEDGVAEPAGAGDTEAAGAGLVDAWAAWQQA